VAGQGIPGRAGARGWTDDNDAIVDQLSTEEAVSLLAGVDTWTVPAIERLGIGPLKMSDGPNGLRGAEFFGGPASVCFPCGTALASSWDVGLVRRVGEALGAEARAKGAHVHLAPTVNLHRSPLGGRNFECFSEDPHLSARMAVAYVTGVQSQGVASCVKHLVANDSEFERFTISSDVDERTLRELYLIPFEAALLEAGAWAVMSAYNRLNGTYCSENQWLLTDLLRDQWEWDGAVVSDWYGTHSTAEALVAGLDIEMPGPPAHRGPRLVRAAEDKAVDPGAVEEAVRRVLLLAARTGARSRLGQPAPTLAPERFEDSAERSAVAREAAAAGIVLLRNEPVEGSPVLPLSGPGTIAVLGPNADNLHVQGGGSAAVRPARVVTPLEGLTAALGSTTVLHEAGAPPATSSRIDPRRMRIPEGVDAEVAEPGAEGILLTYYRGSGFDGEVAGQRVSRRSNLAWLGGAVPRFDLAPGGWSARAATRLLVTMDGAHRLEVRGTGTVVVRIDGDLVHDDEAPEAHGGGAPPSDPSLRSIEVDLSAGEHLVEVDLVPPARPGGLLSCDIRIEEPPDQDRLARAVDAARQAEVAVVVVGVDGDIETEGHDRPDFSLPPAQVDLIRAVAAANPRTVVVVNVGSPVDMSWAEEVPAVVQLWCPGQEGGAALADVLTGRTDASGRLPTTIPLRLEDTPAHGHWPGSEGHAPYSEGVFIGYRHYQSRGLPVRFPFGHGLSYTTFSYGPLTGVPEQLAPGAGFQVAVEVTNTGARPGSEVVQLYIGDEEAALERPPRELKGFSRVHLAPGEKATVRFPVLPRDLAYWDPAESVWKADPGRFAVEVGASSADIRAAAVTELTA